MFFETQVKTLKNGKIAVFRAPKTEDAKEMLEYLKDCARETNFILRCPEECTESIEKEAEFLSNSLLSEQHMMIVCTVDGEIAGNCNISFRQRIKTRHRASLGIAIRKRFLGLGIGTILLEQSIQTAKTKDILQIELGYIDGNERAKHLYEKMGFAVFGKIPNAIRLKDGQFLDEIQMMLQL